MSIGTSEGVDLGSLINDRRQQTDQEYDQE